MKVFEYEKINQPFKNAQGEEFDYIMEDNIILRLPFATIKCSVCNLLKNTLATLLICYLIYVLYII